MTAFDASAFIANLTQRPGVYRMYDEHATLLYVGKAKNLKNRVSSYFRARGLNNKTVALVSRIQRIDITVTANEVEALILEHTLIQKHKPPYNILLKDGKSYPYIHLSDNQYPRISVRRGKRKNDGRYYGPYPNKGAAYEAVQQIQRLFKLRTCKDNHFKLHGRPCFLYELDRCSGACANLISVEDYAHDVEQAELFLNGKSSQLLDALKQDMQAAAAKLAYEDAALIRDKIELVQKAQEQQYVDKGEHNADVWAWYEAEGDICVHRLSFRSGRLLASDNHYPNNPAGEDAEAVMFALMSHVYLTQDLPEGEPSECVVALPNDTMSQLTEAIILAGKKKLTHSKGSRGVRRQWLTMAQENARVGLQARLSDHKQAQRKLAAVADILSLPSPPKRIECFDISHAGGEDTYASCVVYDEQGLAKSRYRRFSIKGEVACDDYAALDQAVTRHFTRLIEQQDTPDLLLIDGGKGQVKRVQQALDALGVSSTYCFGISKGETRKSGWEFLWEAGATRPIMPNAHDEGFHLLQHVRDEAHRFAITGHRKARAKKRVQSDLQSLSGVGPKRRKALLTHFGSLKNLRGASEEEIARVESISQTVAASIYSQLHGDA